jgi:ATP-dependent helicase/nuclease subunit B
VSISAVVVAPPEALNALASAIAAGKGSDALAPVTVAVPTNTCGVMSRRALGRSGGLVGVDMVTLNRLAELIAGPGLAAAGRSPTATPVLDLAVAAALQAEPGRFGAVATHPSTVVAVRELHNELRSADPAARERLSQESIRGRQAVRLSDAVTSRLAADWYDEADLYVHATEAIRRAVPDGLTNVVVYLPQELSGLALGFVRSLGEHIDVRVIVQSTGDELADADARATLAELGVEPSDPAPTLPDTLPVAIISTTDADDEVRIAVRHLLDAARDGTPFERMAVLWPAQQPYARLVEHHLRGADIPWNGRPGTTLTERLVPRLVLDLLDVDQRGLRRRNLFDLLADVPARDAEGTYLPTASWERVSREAGIARDEDWNRRLAPLAAGERWAQAARSLREFVGDLRERLGHPAERRAWSAWSAWCIEESERWLGRHTIERLPESEYRAWEQLTRALDRLGHLDPVDEPVTRHQFRSTLEAELDATPGREGRVGNGVTVGPLAGAIGLDVDVVVILGAAEGQLPPRPTGDPLLSDADRELAGLPTADARSARLHRLLRATVATSSVTLTLPRGDLRATSQVLPSRWIAVWADQIGTTVVESHHAGLEATPFPASPSEHRLRDRYALVRSGGSLADVDDPLLSSGLDCIAGRADADLTVYDGDLTTTSVPRLDGPVSPTRLESWITCPHAYFAQHLLRVRPVEEPGDEITITARDKGSAQHDAVDLLHQAVIDERLPQPTLTGWTDEHRAALIDAFDDVCERNERRGRNGRPAFWADERSRMLADLMEWLARDSDLVIARGSRILASELRFGVDGDVAIVLADGRRIELQGVIDRVDATSDGGLVVTDHKTGGKGAFKGLSAEDPTVGGTLFQLPAYAAAARARFGGPDTVVIAEYGLMRKGDYERRGLVMTPEVDALVQASMASIVGGIESGLFPNRPVRPGFHFYVSCEYCEPDHLGTADRWAEWERKHHDVRLAPWFADPQGDEAELDHPGGDE